MAVPAHDELGGLAHAREMPTNKDRMRVFKERAQRWADSWRMAGLNVRNDMEIFTLPATY